MPLIICPECGKSISTEAVSCPHCGKPGPFGLKADEPQKVETAAAPVIPSGIKKTTEAAKAVKGPGLWFLLAAALVSTACFFAAFVIKNKEIVVPEKQKPATSSKRTTAAMMEKEDREAIAAWGGPTTLDDFWAAWVEATKEKSTGDAITKMGQVARRLPEDVRQRVPDIIVGGGMEARWVFVREHPDVAEWLGNPQFEYLLGKHPEFHEWKDRQALAAKLRIAGYIAAGLMAVFVLWEMYARYQASGKARASVRRNKTFLKRTAVLIAAWWVIAVCYLYATEAFSPPIYWDQVLKVILIPTLALAAIAGLVLALWKDTPGEATEK